MMVQTGWLTITEISFCHSSGGQKSKTKVLMTVLAFSGGFEGESVPGFSPGFWWWLVIFGDPWFVATSPPPQYPLSQGLLSCVSFCVSVSKSPSAFSYKETSHWI